VVGSKGSIVGQSSSFKIVRAIHVSPEHFGLGSFISKNKFQTLHSTAHQK
jgi:hypothetical protein